MFKNSELFFDILELRQLGLSEEEIEGFILFFWNEEEEEEIN